MRILLVQTSFLGDTILSTPVIAAIKALYPEAELWMMTTPLSADLVRRDPLLKGVLTLDKRKGDAGLIGLLRKARKIQSMRFNRAYSLHRSYRTSLLLWLARIPLRIGCSDARLRFLYHRIKTRDFARHDVIRNMSILAGEVPLDPDSMHMRLFAPSLNELRADLQACLPSSSGYAVVVPGSAWRTKMWHWEGFREVIRYLLSRNIGAVLLGAADDRQVCAKVADGLPVVDLSGRTSIAEAMAVIQNARLVICNDSMSLHMASAMKIPTVVIFCATSPAFGYGPWQNRAVVVEQPDLECKPCRRHGSIRCPNGTEACMCGPGPEVVIDAVEQLLTPRAPDRWPILTAAPEAGSVKTQPLTIRYARGRYTIGADRQLTQRHLDQLVEGFQSPDRGVGSTLGGRRSVTRLNLDDIGPVIVKHFLRGGLPAYLSRRTFFRIGKTRGEREFEQMLRVRQLGVQTPEPVAFAYKGDFFYAAWLVTREIQSVQSLAQLSRTAPQRTASALDELTRQVAILIDHGILHSDFHPGNVLIDDQDRVYIIDLDKSGTYWGGRAALRSRYRRRWRRAVRKHGLPPMLCEFQTDAR